jgi:hypothetical protein
MADIIAFKRPKASDRHKGKSLCRHGHHKWVVDKESVFDSKQGRLVTRYRCERCGKIRIKTH